MDKDHAVFYSMASFIDYYNKVKKENTVVFVREDKTLLMSEPEAAWKPIYSKEWWDWAGKELNPWLTTKDFVSFIEDFFVNVLPPPDVKDPGDGSFVFLGNTLDSRFCGIEELLSLARGDIKPNGPLLFLAQIQVFEGGNSYKVPVRLFYKIDGDKILWNLSIYRPDRTISFAYEEETSKFVEAVTPTLYYGNPECQK